MTGRKVAFYQRVLRWLDDTFVQRVPRNAEDYATHIPVLVGLARILRVRRVVEFGGGAFSTTLFLNRRAFPDVERLDTYENDMEWADRIDDIVNGDPRCEVHRVSGEMSTVVPIAIQDAPSLILIDDSTSSAARVRTINAATRCIAADSVVVVHDYEVPDYRKAASEMNYGYRFVGVNPNVGVLWSGRELNRRILKDIDRAIVSAPNELNVSDAESWCSHFSNLRSRGGT